MSLQFKLGSDPETFIFKGIGEAFVPAHTLLPGTKKNPAIIDSEDQSIQVDGVAAEFNTAPTSDADEFAFRVQYMLNYIKEAVHPNVPDPTRDAINIRPYLRSIPEENTVLGCDPDLYVYDSYAPTQSASDFDRFTGGHIHIGWTENANVSDEQHRERCRQMASQLDVFVGVPLAYVRNTALANISNRRAFFYGLLGRYRVKRYGMEYRTPASYWTASPAAAKFIFNQSKIAFDLLQDGQMLNFNYKCNDNAKSYIVRNQKYNLMTAVNYPGRGDLRNLERFNRQMPNQINTIIEELCK